MSDVPDDSSLDLTSTYSIFLAADFLVASCGLDTLKLNQLNEGARLLTYPPLLPGTFAGIFDRGSLGSSSELSDSLPRWNLNFGAMRDLTRSEAWLCCMSLGSRASTLRFPVLEEILLEKPPDSFHLVRLLTRSYSSSSICHMGRSGCDVFTLTGGGGTTAVGSCCFRNGKAEDPAFRAV